MPGQETPRGTLTPPSQDKSYCIS